MGEENKWQPVTFRLYVRGRTGKAMEADCMAEVAAGPEERSGYGGGLLREACHSMWEAERPFVLLAPESGESCESFGFREIYRKPAWRLTEAFEREIRRMLETGSREAEVRNSRVVLHAAEDPTVWNAPDTGEGGPGGVFPREEIQVRAMAEKDAESVADFASRRLQKQYQVYTARDGEYYLMARKKAQAQAGDIFLIFYEKNLAGYVIYAGDRSTPERKGADRAAQEKKGSAREVLLRSRIAEVVLETTERETGEAVMGRMIHAGALLGQMRSGSRMELLLEISDELIPENNGLWRWQCGPESSCAVRLEDAEGLRLYITADKLTEFIFGKRTAEECFQIREGFEWGKREALEKLSQVQVWHDVCLNGIV